MQRIAAALRTRVGGRRRDILRVGLQTAVAAALTYWVLERFGQEENISWAVIAALFSISVSADSALGGALGRIGGVALGLALGIGFGLAVPGPVAVPLALAAAAANMVATGWPSFRYAAVIAAIVALDPSPELREGAERAAAVVVGTLIGAGTTFVILPSFGRGRASERIRQAIGACRALFGTILGGFDTDAHGERDVLHARFLSHLEALRGQIGETLIRPRLASGAPLRDAASALESLWHSLVILDRVVTDERRALGRAVLDGIVPAVAQVRAAADPVLERLEGGLGRARGRAAPTEDLVAAVEGARRKVEAVQRSVPDRRAARRLDALLFAFDEIEGRTLQLARVLQPEAAHPQEAGHADTPPPARDARRDAAVTNARRDAAGGTEVRSRAASPARRGEPRTSSRAGSPRR